MLGAIAVLVACGKGEESTGAPISREEWPARVAALKCEAMSGCCERSGFSFDATACKQSQTAEMEHKVAQFAANVDYDARAAGESLDRLAEGSACGLFDEVAAWEKVFPGKLGPGESCRATEECRKEPGHSVSCSSEDGIPPSVCRLFKDGQPRPHAQLGEACFTTCREGAPCSIDDVRGASEPVISAACYHADGLWCNYGKESPTCTRLDRVGEVCVDPSSSCENLGFCARDTGICTAPLPNGQPCLSRDECQSGYCKEQEPPPSSNAAEPIWGSCVAELPVAAEDCQREAE